ncbi:TOBAMOVIRUS MULTIPLICATION PROTEIN 2A [Salix viminalis]|uniref:TOBAMOVIRUS MULTIPLICATION PROTEIN 2A n=1 Tax=Salix viminalis TaxID=40686 RepID=A0A9Q0QCA6_SALVM|nr:TOBAMOVIRUS MULTIPLICATION PROTEIN 2A [Salix viminalis]
MACKGCLEWLLKLLNILLTLVGLAMIGYGIYLFVEYTRTDDNVALVSTLSDGQGLTQLGRPMLMAVSLSDSFSDKLSKAWFIYVFVAVGIILFIISCFGCIGAATGNGCCLTCYSILIVLLILVELGCAAFIFFDKSWKEEIPTDKTGDFGMVYDFLKENWNIVKWVALGIVILEALIFLLALVVRAANRPVEYDSDDELIAARQQNRQPLLNRPPGPASGAPVAGTTDQRPSRNDAWSTRMREKYGLDTSEFTYNPSEAHRFQPVSAQPTEEKRCCCTIM